MLKLLRTGFFASLTALGTFVALPLPYVILGHPHLPNAEEFFSWHALSGGLFTTSAQTLAVGLAATFLSPLGAFASQVLYVVLGLLGLPLFADGGGMTYLHAPSFPCLATFPAAAWLAARMARARGWRRRWQGLLAAQLLVISVGVASEVFGTGQGLIKEAWWAHAWPTLQSLPALALLMGPLAVLGGLGDALRGPTPASRPAPAARPALPESAPEAPRRAPERPQLPAPPRRLSLPEAPQGRRAIEGPPRRISLPGSNE